MLAALIGSLLLLAGIAHPRHYAALVTIAFALLLKDLACPVARGTSLIPEGLEQQRKCDGDQRGIVAAVRNTGSRSSEPISAQASRRSGDQKVGTAV